MSEHTKPRIGPAGLILTPILLLLLTGGILVLAWSLLPSHQIQKYLSIVFMDNLKTSGSTSGLNILEREIETGTEAEQKQTYETGKINYPHFGEQYAMLSADSIGLSVGVYYGANSELLQHGACQTTQSAIIGEPGNVVVDAHVNTYFSDLMQLQIGDKVTLYTDYGIFTYRVSEQISFLKSDRRLLGITAEDLLTLYTCEANVLGNSDTRVGWRCELVSKAFYEPAA